MKTPPRPPTLRDLAKLAGLAKSTVSEALRDHGRVKISTRNRVHDLARQIGYVPNTFASTLASSKKAMPVNAVKIAVVQTVGAGEWVDGKVVSREFINIERRLRELGYEAELFDTAPYLSSAAPLRHLLYHRGFRGVIFSVGSAAERALLAEDWSSFCVLSARRNLESRFDQVHLNYFKAVCTAWNQARARGYTRIGAIFGRHEPVVLDDLERQGALLILQRGLGSHEKAIPPCLEILTKLPGELKKWYLRHRPDVVIGLNSAFAATPLREAGVRIPEDVAFISLHQEAAEGRFAFVNPDALVLELCAEHMDQMIRHRRTGPPDHAREIVPCVRWSPGPSLPGAIVLDLPEPFRKAGAAHARTAA